MSRRTESFPLVERGRSYARGVLDGSISVCRSVRLAVERDERDRSRQGSAGFPYRFDESKAETALEFFERMPHVKGPKANRGEYLRLEPHQAWFYGTLFGWVHVETGMRRFNRAYRELPRGNGKSFEDACVENFCGFCEGEQGAEVYSAATKRDQAKIVTNTARQMFKKNAELARLLGVEVNAHTVYQDRTGSLLSTVSSDYDSLDGLNVYMATIDELHAHSTRGLYDVFETAISKRDQALLLMTTTAGSDRTGICYEIRSDLLAVLEGRAEDDRFFGVVYTLDEDDDWRSEASWHKANPNLGVSVNLETLRSLAKKAERVPAAQNAFKTKHLNIWVGADAALYDIERWQRLANPELARADFSGEHCLVALDLASKNDLAARMDVFWRFRESDGKPVFSVFAHHYTNRAAVDEGKNAQFPAWELQGLLKVSDGDSTDQQRIEDDIFEDAAVYQLLEVNVDNFQSAGIAQRLAARGLTVVEVPQQVRHLSTPTKYLDDLIREGRIEHDGDPCLAWQIGNVVGHFDVKDNVYPRKERPENKIDAVVALIMALSRAITMTEMPGDLSRHYAEEGISLL